MTCGLTACSDPSGEIHRVATQLADALETGNTQGLWADADLSIPLTNLADLPRTVDVAAVGDPRTLADDGPQAADVTLRWAWDLDDDGATDWSYTTQTRAVQDAGDHWRTPYDESMVAPGLGTGAELRLQRTPARRGEIVASDGTAIVTDRPVLRIGVDKTRFEDGTSEERLRTAAESLAQLAGLADPSTYADRVLAAGPRAFVEALTVRTDNHDLDLTALSDIPGGVALPSELPLAPTATWARPVLGRVGEATAEVIQASNGAIEPGDLVGLSGLQRIHDEDLRGTPGLVVTSHIGGDSERLFERPPVDGRDLRVTLDPWIQTAAEDALANTDTPAGLVAIRPSTGEIVAAASGPGSEGLDIAMQASLAPGSTFKVVSALALLRAGLGPETTVSCTRDVTVSGYRIGNYTNYPGDWIGDIPLTQALAHSCNTALINARKHLDPADLAAAAASLGIGRPMPGSWPAFLGSIPSEMTDTELAVSLIGQGDVLASPLAMATVAASVQAGTTVTPTLIGEPDEAPGEQSPSPSSDNVSSPLTAAEAGVLSRYMRAVVTDGTASLLADLPGPPVHAKTGSAEAGAGNDLRVDSWLIAFQGDLAVAALVHSGGDGSGAAGTAVRTFLEPTTAPKSEDGAT